MKNKLTKNQILNLKQFCPNLKIGGSCWARCPYRENGRCELDAEEILALAIEYLAEGNNEKEVPMSPIEVNVIYTVNGKQITQNTKVEVYGYCRNIDRKITVKGQIDFMTEEKFTLFEDEPSNSSYDFYLEDAPVVKIIR